MGDYEAVLERAVSAVPPLTWLASPLDSKLRQQEVRRVAAEWDEEEAAAAAES